MLNHEKIKEDFKRIKIVKPFTNIIAGRNIFSI